MVKQAYKRMTRLCSRGEYCVFDIRQKLRGMELSEEGEEAVVQKLKENHFRRGALICRFYQRCCLTAG